MASFNRVLLMGNLTKQPELRYTPSGSAVTDFGLAMNRTYTSNGEKKEEACFVDVSVWGKQAESVSKYLQKGSPVFVEGRLQLDQWEDKETRKPRSRLRVVAERVQFLGSSKSGTHGEPEGYDDGGSDSSHSSAGAGFAPQQQYVQTSAPSVPPPQAAFRPAPAPQQQQRVQPAAPRPEDAQNPPPNEVFNSDAGVEDDIPF